MALNFSRKITDMIRALESCNEGAHNPKTVAILKEMDKELAALKKAEKPKK